VHQVSEQNPDSDHELDTYAGNLDIEVVKEETITSKIPDDSILKNETPEIDTKKLRKE